MVGGRSNSNSSDKSASLRKQYSIEQMTSSAVCKRLLYDLLVAVDEGDGDRIILQHSLQVSDHGDNTEKTIT